MYLPMVKQPAGQALNIDASAALVVQALEQLARAICRQPKSGTACDMQSWTIRREVTSKILVLRRV